MARLSRHRTRTRGAGKGATRLCSALLACVKLHDEEDSSEDGELLIHGTVTSLPVHEGVMVVVWYFKTGGIMLMTVADMKVITAEVRVDETDIVNLKLGQSADVTIQPLFRTDVQPPSH